MMFELFFAGAQQDLKLIIIPVIISALFRMAFIEIYGDKDTADYGKKYKTSLWFGFLWGLDFHAYVYLIPLLLVSIPASWISVYYDMSDTLRILWVAIYAFAMYVVFMGKMIFYGEFHDIFNQTMLLGKNADKGNFADIFFHDYYGAWILLGLIPYMALTVGMTSIMLKTPTISYPVIDGFLGYFLNTLVFIALGVLFYLIRYGGHLSHLFKPSRNNMPTILKNDIFFSKVVVDDFIAIELVLKQQEQKILKHTDEETAKILTPLMDINECKDDIWKPFLHKAQGARIRQPKHIYLIVGESYGQAPFDKKYSDLHIVDEGKKFRASPHTVTVSNFLAAGMISQPSLASLFSGIFDANFEINEMPDFQQKQVPTALAAQMKKLGYTTAYWYGGNTAWASLGRFGKAQGFDMQIGAVEYCDKDAPKTWLGVYDHLFFEGLYKEILKLDKDTPMFHLIYTTSNHPPYNIPVQKYGFEPDKVLAEMTDDIKKDKKLVNNLGMYWYADYYMCDFIRKVQVLDPDSFIIVTGDHPQLIIPFDTEKYPAKGPNVREKYGNSFAMYHPDFEKNMFPQLNIAGHMNIMPTIIEAIAPKGFEYYSLMPSLFEEIEKVVTPFHWLNQEMMGYYDDTIAQNLNDNEVKQGITNFEEERKAWCELTAWIIKHPEKYLI